MLIYVFKYFYVKDFQPNIFKLTYLKGDIIIRKNVQYAITAVSIIILITIAGIFYFSEQRMDCNTGNYDAFYFIKALRMDNSQLCEKVMTKTYKERCLAATEKNELLCSTIESKRDDFCVALAKKDVLYCNQNTACKALLTGDASSCINDASALNVSFEQVAKIKNACNAYAQQNAEFFITKQMLKKC